MRALYAAPYLCSGLHFTTEYKRTLMFQIRMQPQLSCVFKHHEFGFIEKAFQICFEEMVSFHGEEPIIRSTFLESDFNVVCTQQEPQ